MKDPSIRFWVEDRKRAWGWKGDFRGPHWLFFFIKISRVFNYIVVQKTGISFLAPRQSQLSNGILAPGNPLAINIIVANLENFHLTGKKGLC